MAAVMAARSSAEASNQVGTCLRGTISRWPSLTGNASQRALVSRSSKAIRSWMGKQKGQAAGVASFWADLAVRRVISSAPSRPAAAQEAQRHAFTGRRPTRLDWQTGHQWSYTVGGASLGLGWCFRRGLLAASL